MLIRQVIKILVLACVPIFCVLSITSIAVPIMARTNTTAIAQTTQVKPNSDRYERGLDIINKVNRQGAENARKSVQDIAPDLMRYAIEYPYGDLLSRPGLDLKSRQIATVAALTALGNAQPQLKFHINGALNVGCTRTEIVELITQMSAYAGFPAAFNGIAAAKEVFQARDAQGLKN